GDDHRKGAVIVDGGVSRRIETVGLQERNRSRQPPYAEERNYPNGRGADDLAPAAATHDDEKPRAQHRLADEKRGIPDVSERAGEERVPAEYRRECGQVRCAETAARGDNDTEKQHAADERNEFDTERRQDPAGCRSD